MRLGINTIDNMFIEQMINIIKLNNFIGLVGGKNSSSYYFFGIDNYDNNLLYLDPHIIQEYNVEQTAKEIYHTQNFNKLSIDKLNPSLAFGFYCKDLNDFIEFTYNIKTLNDYSNPLIIVDYNKDYKDENILKVNPINNINSEWEIL